MGSITVNRYSPHSFPHLGFLNDKLKGQHEEDRNSQNSQLDIGHCNGTKIVLDRFEGLREGTSIGTKEIDHPVFQEKGNPDGCNQSCNFCGIAKRTIGQELNQDTQTGCQDHGQDQGNKEIELEAIDEVVTNKSPHHIEVSVGKVDQLNDAVYHGIT